MVKLHCSNFRIKTFSGVQFFLFLRFSKQCISLNEPPHGKTNKIVCAPSEDSDQPGQSSLCAQWVAKDPTFLHADSEDSDQTGRMPRLI